MIDNRKKYLVIDPENGEVVGERIKGDKVIPQRIYENWIEIYGKEATLDCEPFNMGKYVKISDIALQILPTVNLTSLETRVMLYLLQFVQWNSNLVSHKNKKPIQSTTISKQFDVDVRTIDIALRGLRKKGVLFVRTTAGSIKTFFNPCIFMRGNFIVTALKEMFVDTEFYKAWAETSTAKYNRKGDE